MKHARSTHARPPQLPANNPPRPPACRHATQIQYDTGLPAFTSPTEAVAYAARLIQRYSAARPLSAGLDERERGPADELLVLASCALVRAHLLEPAGAVHLLQVGAEAGSRPAR
jgi:hypothetical protein